jgi:drug/metabolite transporter (DMT)-like permease
MKRRGAAFDAADAAMLVVVLVWAANNLVVKGALSELDPLAYVAGRFAIVAALLFGWMAAKRRIVPPAPGDLPRFLFAGLFGFAVYNALFTIGLDRTSVFSVALLVSLGPIFTLLLAALLRMDRVRLGQWAGVALATAGVALFVAAKSRAAGPYDPTGDLLSLLAAFLFAAYSLATRPLVARYGAAPATAWSALIGLACILPVAWPSVLRQDWADLSLRSWGSLVYASAISMLAGYTLWTWAIEQRGAARTAPYLFLIPIVTGVLAALFFGERLGPVEMAGAGLVLAGTAVVRLAAARPAVRLDDAAIVVGEPLPAAGEPTRPASAPAGGGGGR